jgi:hypothetical protein
MCSGWRRMVALFMPPAVTGTGTPIRSRGALPAAASAGSALMSQMRPAGLREMPATSPTLNPPLAPQPGPLPTPCQRKVC